MISYDGTIYFGLAGDRDVVPDLDDLGGALREALREQPVPRRKPAKKAKPGPKAKAEPRKKRAIKRVRTKAAAARGKRKTKRRGSTPG
jgi:hypothetical protein